MSVQLLDRSGVPGNFYGSSISLSCSEACGNECPTKVTRMRIGNLCCAGEERIIKNVLDNMRSIHQYSTSVIGKYAVIKHCPNDCCESTAPHIRDKLNDMRLGVSIQETNEASNSNKEEDESEQFDFHCKVMLATILAIIFVAGLICSYFGYGSRILFLSCVTLGVIPIVYDVYLAFIRRAVDIHVLMLIAIVGALSIQQFLDASLVVTLFTLASLVEESVLRWVRGIVEVSNTEIPTECTLAHGEVVQVSSLKVGDVVVYKAGDMISMDGKVIKGMGVIDEAALTGEAKPITKRIDSQAHSGTVMQDGYIEVEVTELPENSTVSKLQETISEVQADKGETVTLVDDFAAYWTPTVLISAFSLFVIAGAITRDWNCWMYRSLAMLVLACPCSIVIAAPIPCVIGIANAARKGVIVKGSSVIEAAGEVDTVAVDKTGTLTKGHFELIDMEEINSHEGDTSIDALKVAASLESKSSHPLAAAIVSAYSGGCIAGSLSDELCDVQDVKTVAGIGMSGWVATDEDDSDWVFSIVGNEKLLTTTIDGFKCVLSPMAMHQYNNFTEKHSKSGASILMCCIDDQLRLLVALSDVIRPEAAKMCRNLSSKDITVTMLTGDHPTIAHHVAARIGIQGLNVKARLLPIEKLDWVKNANSRGEKVMMLGDGINDAAALTASHLGVAMGSGCSAMTSLAAKIIILSDNLLRVSSVLELCKWIRYVICVNISSSVSLKVFAIVLAVTGNLALWQAVLIDIFSLLFVVGLSCMIMCFEWAEPEPIMEEECIALNKNNRTVNTDLYEYANIPSSDDCDEETYIKGGSNGAVADVHSNSLILSSPSAESRNSEDGIVKIELTQSNSNVSSSAETSCSGGKCCSSKMK